MSRMKRNLLSCCVLFGMVCSLLTTAFAVAAPNDLRRHWSSEIVYTMMNQGIVTGYPDGTFRPEQAFSRQEAAALLFATLKGIQSMEPVESTPSQDIPVHSQNRATQEQETSTVPTVPAQPIFYTDLEQSWAKEQIEALGQLGIGLQDGSGCFYPEQVLTRAEGAVLIEQVLRQNPTYSLTTDTALQTVIFSDIASHPAQSSIAFVSSLGFMDGMGDGTFAPDAHLTRAQWTTILFRLSGSPLMTPVEFAPLPTKTVIDVPYISQVYPVGAWVGCEATSLLMGLKGKGYAQDVSLTEFLDRMPKTESNPAKGFVGSPYVPNDDLRTTIYPAPLAAYGSQYGKVVDFSGKSVEELREEVLLGNPVVIYVTLYWRNPIYDYYQIEGETQLLLANNHALLVCGYDQTTNQYYIADPYNIDDRYHDYYYWIDGSTLEPLYMVRQHAVAVE